MLKDTINNWYFLEVDSDNNSFVSCEVAAESANSSLQSRAVDNAGPADEPSTQSSTIGEEGREGAEWSGREFSEYE